MVYCLFSLQGKFLEVLASDWRYERALQGIRLLAQHHVGQLVQAIIAWRQAVNEDIKKNFSTNNVVNVQGVCKRVRSSCHQSNSMHGLTGGMKGSVGASSAIAVVCRGLRAHEVVWV